MLQWHNEPLFKFSLHKWGLGVNWPQKPMHQTPTYHITIQSSNSQQHPHICSRLERNLKIFITVHMCSVQQFFLFINLPICRFIYLRLLLFSNTNLWIVKKWRVLNCPKTFLIVHLHFDTNNNVFWYSNSPYHVAFAYLTGKKWIIVSNHLFD